MVKKWCPRGTNVAADEFSDFMASLMDDAANGWEGERGEA
jgi:hypothetical protein